jgi:hypothetical protein
MVCPADWEPRHPSDFYRGRNDSHKLPWTRPDDGADPATVWTPGLTSGTSTLNNATGETGAWDNGSYYFDTLKSRTDSSAKTLHGSFNATFKNSNNLILPFPNSTTTSTSAALTLPVAATGKGSCVVVANGKVLSQVAIAAGDTTNTWTNWLKVNGGLIVSVTYGVG